ncbi:hypothetical protein SteCoe_12474 [Stentor coeruleus]|uniref:Uncharacterized protein n=1 Tax=Stentor coeruleus TaxID=5963 RepID=A0A1R2CAT6_9CILI|nr:hypothetical protein SteCoe_12474 [Stentor coeruleus]
MEAFYNRISGILEAKSSEFSRAIEEPHKLIIGKSYRCMSDCYSLSYSIEKCSECAEDCNSSVRNLHRELQDIVENVQSEFQGCIQNCRKVYGKNDGFLMECIEKCAKEAGEKFDTSKTLAERIINKYST